MSERDTSAGTAGQVKDDELTSRRIKKRILKSRERVDTYEQELFLGAAEDGISEHDDMPTRIWGNTVKQYLRNVETLLRSTERGTHYYTEVDLGSVRLVPPKTGRYDFSRIASAADEMTLKRELGLTPDADLPQPKTVEFIGLRSIIEADTRLTHQWEVCINPKAAPPNREYVRPTVNTVIPRWIFETAVRAADSFLHDVGIGVKIEEQSEWEV